MSDISIWMTANFPAKALKGRAPYHLKELIVPYHHKLIIYFSFLSFFLSHREISPQSFFCVCWHLVSCFLVVSDLHRQLKTQKHLSSLWRFLLWPTLCYSSYFLQLYVYMNSSSFLSSVISL